MLTAKDAFKKAYPYNKKTLSDVIQSIENCVISSAGECQLYCNFELPSGFYEEIQNWLKSFGYDVYVVQYTLNSLKIRIFWHDA